MGDKTRSQFGLGLQRALHATGSVRWFLLWPSLGKLGKALSRGVISSTFCIREFPPASARMLY